MRDGAAAPTWFAVAIAFSSPLRLDGGGEMAAMAAALVAREEVDGTAVRTMNLVQMDSGAMRICEDDEGAKVKTLLLRYGSRFLHGGCGESSHSRCCWCWCVLELRWLLVKARTHVAVGVGACWSCGGCWCARWWCVVAGFRKVQVRVAICCSLMVQLQIYGARLFWFVVAAAWRMRRCNSLNGWRWWPRIQECGGCAAKKMVVMEVARRGASLHLRVDRDGATVVVEQVVQRDVQLCVTGAHGGRRKSGGCQHGWSWWLKLGLGFHVWDEGDDYVAVYDWSDLNVGDCHMAASKWMKFKW